VCAHVNKEKILPTAKNFSEIAIIELKI